MVEKVGLFALALLAFVVIGSTTSVKVSWERPGDFTPMGYTIYKSVAPGCVCRDGFSEGFKPLANVAPSQFAYTDDAPVIGANYYYVTAFGQFKESLLSHPICFQVLQGKESR